MIDNQNEEFHELRDRIQNIENSIKWQKEILQDNNQEIPGGKIAVSLTVFSFSSIHTSFHSVIL